MANKKGGMLKRIIAFVVVVAFVYLVITSSQFRNYSVNKIKSTNTSLQLSLNSTEQFYNITEYMNQSSFIIWSENHTNNSVVSNVLSGSKNYSDGIAKLKEIWLTINRLYTNSTNSYNASKALYSQIKNISNSSS